MSDISYVVTGPGAIVTTVDGTAVTVMRGGPVPSNASPAAIEHLLAVGLIEEAAAVGGLPAVYAGDGSVLVTSPVVDAGPVVGDAADPVDDVDGDGPIPPKSATKDVWIDYAVSQGATPEDAEALTKDQLIEQYGVVAS